MQSGKKTKLTEKSKKNLVGKWVHLKWDDIGLRSALVVEQQDKTIKVYTPRDEWTEWADTSQVVTIGPYLKSGF